jgi:hypothetical protein
MGTQHFRPSNGKEMEKSRNLFLAESILLRENPASEADHLSPVTFTSMRTKPLLQLAKPAI